MLCIANHSIRCVTFDCWNTLLWDPDPWCTFTVRAAKLRAALCENQIEVTEQHSIELLASAWKKHDESWRSAVATGAIDVARWALEAAGASSEATLLELTRALESVPLERTIEALPGAARLLASLHQLGVPCALVCDTGMTPAAITRALLQRSGLLSYLPVQVFSDELATVKPDARMFSTALGQLAVEPCHAVHVGDNRRTDVAGARALGMLSIRLSSPFDDRSALEDAPIVVGSLAEVGQVLGLWS